MIDPIEAVLALLRADAQLAALTGGRIASKQNYGRGRGQWEAGQVGLVVRPDGGLPDLDVPVQPLRLEADIYAPTQPQAVAVWLRLVALSRAVVRRVMTTTQGAALVYWLHQASGLSLLHDRDLGMELALGFFEAQVAEEVVT